MSATFSVLLFFFGALNSLNATGNHLTNQTGFMSVEATPVFTLDGKDVCIDENFTVPVTVSDFEMITSFQFTIGWDNSLINFDTISFITSELGSTLLFHELSTLDNGVLAISWYDSDVSGITLDDLSEVFHIKFNAIAGNQTSIDVTFEDVPTVKEVSGFVGNDVMVIDAVFNNGEVSIDQQELDTYEVINDVDNSNVGGVNITVKNGTKPYVYIWSNDSEVQNLVNVGVGDYWVTVTDVKGCEETFGPFTVDNTVNVNEIATLRSIGLYPNPTGDYIHLNVVFENTEELEIAIFNIFGMKILTEQLVVSSLDYDVDVSNLSEGTYFLQLRTSNGVHTEKIEILR